MAMLSVRDLSRGILDVVFTKFAWSGWLDIYFALFSLWL